jgi:hypothetical protein
VADFFEAGAPGQWDEGGTVRPCSALIPLKDKVMMYYCSGLKNAGFTGVGLVSWRRDGFVSLHAGADGGELLTSAFIVTGPELHLNLDAPTGEAVVEVCDPQGQPMAGFDKSRPIRADATDATVTWPGQSLSRLMGRAITLRFKLRNADLYSFWLSNPRAGKTG